MPWHSEESPRAGTLEPVQGGWQFAVRDSRLHLAENVISPFSFPPFFLEGKMSHYGKQ